MHTYLLPFDLHHSYICKPWELLEMDLFDAKFNKMLEFGVLFLLLMASEIVTANKRSSNILFPISFVFNGSLYSVLLYSIFFRTLL